MAKNKKILVYSTQMLETGGIESHVTEFIVQMAKNSNSDIDLLILNAQLSSNQLNDLKAYTHSSLFSNKRMGAWGFIRICWFIFKSRFTNYDALYTNGQGNSIYWVAKCFRYRNWVHHHHTSGDLLDQKTWSAKYIKALKMADVVIACSRKNASYMQTVLNRAIRSIPCFSRAVSTNGMQPPKGARGKIHLGYYGRLIPEKGIDIIAALSNDPEMNHIQFHIWGVGEKYPPEYFSLYPNLCYHGKFYGTDALANVLALLDGYLLLSTHPEGLPISLLEVMSAGKPWLATNKGGVSDIACDPVSTRLLDSITNFAETKREILGFVHDIGSGKVSQQRQKALYESKFASPVLIKQWRSILYT